MASVFICTEPPLIVLFVIRIAFVYVVSVLSPYVPAGDAALVALPARNAMPPPDGKCWILLPSIVALVQLETVPADPNAMSSIPEACEFAVTVLLVIVLFEMLPFDTVPAKL